MARKFEGPKNLILVSGLFRGVTYAKNPATGRIEPRNIDLGDRWEPLNHEEANDFCEENPHLYLIPRQAE